MQSSKEDVHTGEFGISPPGRSAPHCTWKEPRLVSSVEPSDSGQDVATPTLAKLARIYKIGVTRILVLVGFVRQRLGNVCRILF